LAGPWSPHSGVAEQTFESISLQQKLMQTIGSSGTEQPILSSIAAFGLFSARLPKEGRWPTGRSSSSTRRYTLSSSSFKAVGV
jgi:hypothetical protein